ncbi:hypothetical protein ZPAH1_orf00264 [Aeromonas phage ZPAH1]|nr:hypothetical protein ASwh1_216 [Aeromonas phage Aswh_1]QQG34026.1 hypothetical protein ZPAH1_orf00264 [Aeromonas phage ZPAH1]
MTGMTVWDSDLTKLCAELINSSPDETQKRIFEQKVKDNKFRFDSELSRTKEYLNSIPKSDQERFIKALMK